MRTCPRCGSEEVHRSRTRTVAERLRRVLTRKRPHHCYACGWRGWAEVTEHAHRAEPAALLAFRDTGAADFDAIDGAAAGKETKPAGGKEPENPD